MTEDLCGRAVAYLQCLFAQHSVTQTEAELLHVAFLEFYFRHIHGNVFPNYFLYIKNNGQLFPRHTVP